MWNGNGDGETQKVFTEKGDNGIGLGSGCWQATLLPYGPGGSASALESPLLFTFCHNHHPPIAPTHSAFPSGLSIFQVSYKKLALKDV